jgi:hypothetical protein
MKINSCPEEMGVLIAGRIGTRAAAVFIQTLQEIRELPNIPELFKATDAELKRLAPTTISGFYGLAYGLNALAANAKKLVQIMHIFTVMASAASGSLPKQEIVTMGLSLFHDTLYNKSWSVAVFANQDYVQEIIPIILSIPDLSDIAVTFQN